MRVLLVRNYNSSLNIHDSVAANYLSFRGRAWHRSFVFPGNDSTFNIGRAALSLEGQQIIRRVKWTMFIYKIIKVFVCIILQECLVTQVTNIWCRLQENEYHKDAWLHPPVSCWTQLQSKQQIYQEKIYRKIKTQLINS